MKTLIKLTTCCMISLYFSLVSILTAQITDDPFEGHYSIAKSAEAFLFEIINHEEVTAQNFDFNIKNYAINPWWNKINAFGDFPWACIDVIAADLNGDSDDEIIQVMYSSPQKADIRIFDVTNQGIQLIFQLPAFDCVTDKEMATTRLIAGNFVADAKEEFAIAYISTDNKFHVNIYETVDSINKLVGSDEIIVAKKADVKDNIEFDFTGDHFDITAIDYDKDGIDEIVMVHKFHLDYIPRNFSFELVSFNYTINQATLSTTKSNIGPIKLDYGDAQGHYTHRLGRISRPSLACGDVDGNGTDEIVFGYIASTRHDYFPAQAHKSELFTVHILGINSQEKGDFFNGPNLILVGSHIMSGHSQNWARHHFSMTVDCADFNNDGKDEIVCNGPDSLQVLSYNFFSYQLEKKTGMPCYNHLFYDHRSPSFAIADVNIDTSSSEWTKEIVYMRYSPRPRDSWGRSMGDIRLGIATLENGNLQEKDSLLIQPESYAKDNQLRYILALGDFDGDGLRLGYPELVATISDVREPRVIINAPPVHFDIFDDMAYDLGSAFNGNSEFVSSYTHSEGVTNELLIKNVADWAYSFGGSFEADAVVGNLNTAYIGRHGQYFENSDFNTESIVEVTSIDASKYDWYYTTITDYHIFEYPLLYDSGTIGHVLVQYPEFKEDEWTYSKSQDARHLIPNHEIGNILSYTKLTDIRDSDSLSIEGTKYTLSDEYPAEGGYWQMDLTNTNKTSFLKKTYNNNSWELNIRMGAKLEFFGLNLGGYYGFNSKGRYDTETIISSAITAGTGTNIKVNFGKLDKLTFGEVDYKIKPYVYYSTNGAFILDYITEPIRGDTWWEEHYAQHPDLAFILPWRYDTEKGYPDITESKRTQTKDLIFVPRHPEPGDTVIIVTRIHNYSLKDLYENVSIQYFLGDPDNGGELMNVLYDGLGTSNIVLSADLPEREEMAFKVDWVIPSDITYQPRIYAVIDPDNLIAEIHENNNKGNTVLEIKGLTTTIDEYAVTIPLKYSLEQNYPNPFNASTNIRFTLKTREIVSIDIYNIFGQKVRRLVNMDFPAGQHMVRLNANDLASGLYFYRIDAGNFVDYKKMLLLK